jgi:HK97 family phage major capsid protein
MNTQELLQKKGELANQADEILKRAKEDGRYDLTSDENQRFDAIHADIEKITAFISKEEKQAALAEASGRRSEAPQPSSERRNDSRIIVPGRATNQDRQDALRGWFMAGTDTGPTEYMREAGRRTGLNLESKHMQFRLAPTALRADTPEGHAEWERRAAMGTTSGAVGQYTVPDEAMRALEVSLLAFGGMRQVSTVIRTDSGADLPIPTSDDTSNKGAILSENTQASEVDITFGQIVLQSFKYSSKYVLVSVELLQDSSINVAEFIGKALGERIGRITNDHFTTGDASSKPNGIVTAAGAGVTATALTATTTYDNVVDLVHSVDPAYRDKGKFMFHDGGLKMLKKIKVLQYSGDTTGVPLWSPGLAPGAPDTILGYPYVINQSMTTPATSVKSILFGDFSKYLIRDVRDVTLLRLDERFADYHQVGFLAFSRHDGDLLDAGTDPVKYHVQG